SATPSLAPAPCSRSPSATAARSVRAAQARGGSGRLTARLRAPASAGRAGSVSVAGEGQEGMGRETKNGRRQTERSGRDARSGRADRDPATPRLRLPGQPVAQRPPDTQPRSAAGHEHRQHPEDRGARDHQRERNPLDHPQPQPQRDPLGGAGASEPSDRREDQHRRQTLRQPAHATRPAPAPAPTGTPVNVAPVVPVSRTRTNCPTSSGPPGNATTLLDSVRPSTSPGLRASFSTSTSTSRPTSPRLISAWISRCTAMSFSRRAWATSSGTNCSGGSRVAGVPSRGEKRYMNASSYRTARTRSSVASNSSSVSPGNATMMSVESAMSGIASRTIRTFSRYEATV